MTLELTVSPDFPPDAIGGWYLFNTWLQRKLGVRIHLELYDSFEAQRAALDADRIDLMYANAVDACRLVRNQGFRALVAPAGPADEAVIAVAQASTATSLADLPPGLRVASSHDPSVQLIARTLLDAANLTAEDITLVPVASHILVAKSLLGGRADAGLFPLAAFDALSGPVRRQLRPLVTSEIGAVRHVLLAGPRCTDQHDALKSLLLAMQADTTGGAAVLAGLGMSGWEDLRDEDTAGMIDLIETLQT